MQKLTNLHYIFQESVSSYAMYTIRVRVTESWGTCRNEVQDVFRRYSDFHALHEKICYQYPNISSRYVKKYSRLM